MLQPSSRLSVAATLARAALKLVIVGCIVLANHTTWGYITDSYFVRYAKIFDNWGLDYPYQKGVEAQGLDAYDTSFIVFIWLPLLLMAYCAMLLLVIPHGAVPRAYKYARRLFTRMLDWEIPPRRFWTWWCGGMNGRDFIVVGFAIAFNLWYFIDYYNQYDDWLDAFAATGIPFPEPRWRLMLERVALIAGIMMWPCIWLLFLPIPQSNFLQWLSGLSYTQMIRYHRWLGHITMVVLSLHAWLYYLYWALNEAFWVNFSDWETLSTINYLAGSISYIAGLVLWVTSINWVRRRFFEVYYRCHIICFVLFTAFAYMHYFWSWSYFLPGLILYGVDLALRAGQLSNTTVVTGAAVDNEAGVATVQLKTSLPASKCPVGELFMLVPTISRWQWHPITVAGRQPDPQGSGNILTLSIKRYGKWTKELLERLQRPEALAMRVSAPMGPSHDHWKGCKAMVLLGGGIGATPLLAMLRDMIAMRKNDPKSAQDLPERVHFVWASRQPREFCLLDEELLEVAGSSDGWLTVDLYSTRALPIQDALPSKPMEQNRDDSPRNSSESGSDLKHTDSIAQKGSGDFQNAASAMAMQGTEKKLDSPYFHKVPRVVQPQAINLVHLAIVYALTWFGAFMGTVLGSHYVGEVAIYYGYPARNRNGLWWKAGLAWFFTQAVLTIGIPYVLAVLPVHIYRYWRANRQTNSPEVLPAVPAGHPVGHGSPTQLVGGRITATGESGIEVKMGRPNLREAIESVSLKYARHDTVGVIVGGPEVMTRQVQLDAAALNNYGQPGPYHAFKALAFFL